LIHINPVFSGCRHDAHHLYADLPVNSSEQCFAEKFLRRIILHSCPGFAFQNIFRADAASLTSNGKAHAAA
jgi:hypothetical protein